MNGVCWVLRNPEKYMASILLTLVPPATMPRINLLTICRLFSASPSLGIPIYHFTTPFSPSPISKVSKDWFPWPSMYARNVPQRD